MLEYQKIKTMRRNNQKGSQASFWRWWDGWSIKEVKTLRGLKPKELKNWLMRSLKGKEDRVEEISANKSEAK